jgi:hypothetical protein
MIILITTILEVLIKMATAKKQVTKKAQQKKK